MRFDSVALQLAHSRRNFLNRCGGGVGIAALAHLLAKDGLSAPQRELPATNPLEPKRPQFDAKAKSVIFLFMEGGPSQIDLFDPKPAKKSSFRLHQTDCQGLGQLAKIQPIWPVGDGFLGLAAASFGMR